jgi:hypothetical protein
MADPIKNRKQGKNWENVVHANMGFGTTRIPDRVGGADYHAWNGHYYEAKSGNSQLTSKQAALRDQDPERYHVERGPGNLPNVPNISERVFLPEGYRKRQRLQDLDDTDIFDY